MNDSYIILYQQQSLYAVNVKMPLFVTKFSLSTPVSPLLHQFDKSDNLGRLSRVLNRDQFAVVNTGTE